MSQDETKELIDKVAKELMLASHQSRDKEVSALFKEIRTEIRNMRKDLDSLEQSFKSLEEQVVPNIQTWNKTSEGFSRIAWIVITAVLAVFLGALGLQI